jgi:hypothetical protein
MAEWSVGSDARPLLSQTLEGDAMMFCSDCMSVKRFAMWLSQPCVHIFAAICQTFQTPF